jgi:GT2 family glycosyltransferase
MAVRAKVFTEGHLFDDAIGAEGNRWGPVETEFNNRLARLGHRAYFVAEARVKHIVRPEQISETWMLERAYRHGLGFYLYHQHLLERHNRRIIGLPPGIALRHLLYGIAAPLARLLPRSQPQFHILFQNQWYRGLVDYIREAEKTNK